MASFNSRPMAKSPPGRPIGTTIAFRGASGIEIVPATGGMAVPLAGGEGGQAPSWAPDGSRIAFEIDGAGIFTVSNLGGTPQSCVLESSAEEPSWSRDGKWIAFQAQPGNSAATDIYFVAPGSCSTPMILVAASDLGADAYSPDFGPAGDVALIGGSPPAAGIWIATGLPTPVVPSSWSGGEGPLQGQRFEVAGLEVRSTAV